jgi:hypothetical protein
LPVEVDEVSPWRVPSLLIETAAEGVMPTSPVDLVKLLEAARQLRQRARGPFFQLIAVGLAACPECDDGDLDRLIRYALRKLHCERRVTL